MVAGKVVRRFAWSKSQAPAKKTNTKEDLSLKKELTEVEEVEEEYEFKESDLVKEINPNEIYTNELKKIENSNLLRNLHRVQRKNKVDTNLEDDLEELDQLAEEESNKELKRGMEYTGILEENKYGEDELKPEKFKF